MMNNVTNNINKGNFQSGKSLYIRTIILILSLGFAFAVITIYPSGAPVAAQISRSNNGNVMTIPLEGLDGNTIYLENYKDKVIILEFMATWCTTCAQQEVILKEFWPIYQNDNVVLISVSTDPTFDTLDVLRNHVENKEITWLMTRDTTLAMTSYFQITDLSTIIIISPDGEIMNTFKGVTDIETLTNAIENIL